MRPRLRHLAALLLFPAIAWGQVSNYAREAACTDMGFAATPWGECADPTNCCWASEPFNFDGGPFTSDFNPPDSQPPTEFGSQCDTVNPDNPPEVQVAGDTVNLPSLGYVHAHSMDIGDNSNGFGGCYGDADIEFTGKTMCGRLYLSHSGPFTRQGYAHYKFLDNYNSTLGPSPGHLWFWAVADLPSGLLDGFTTPYLHINPHFCFETHPDDSGCSGDCPSGGCLGQAGYCYRGYESGADKLCMSGQKTYWGWQGGNALNQLKSEGAVTLADNCTIGVDPGTGWCEVQVCYDHVIVTPGVTHRLDIRYRIVDIDTGATTGAHVVGTNTPSDNPNATPLNETRVFSGRTGRSWQWNFGKWDGPDGTSRLQSHFMIATADTPDGTFWIGPAQEILEDVRNGAAPVTTIRSGFLEQ